MATRKKHSPKRPRLDPRPVALPEAREAPPGGWRLDDTHTALLNQARKAAAEGATLTLDQVLARLR